MYYQSSFNNNKATLYLVGTPIGNLDEISYRVSSILKKVNAIYCESISHANIILNKINVKKHLYKYSNGNEKIASHNIIKMLKENNDVALISDAGYPLISDPGYMAVKLAIINKFNVVPIGLNCAAIAALVISGFNIGQFVFIGFLEKSIASKNNFCMNNLNYNSPVIFYESPHRLVETLEIFAKFLPRISICLAKEITKIYEQFWWGEIEEVIGDLKKLDKIKGEFVIILESGYLNPNQSKLAMEKINEEIIYWKNQGLKLRKAIELISKKYNINKNNLYNKYNHNQRNSNLEE